MTGLPPGFRLVELTNEDYQKYWNDWGARIFDADSTILDLRKLLSDEERAKLRELSKNTAPLERLNLGVFQGDEFCAWFSGDQYNYETFYMRNSAVLPAFRRRGLYTALMHEVLRWSGARGYQIVLSRHATTNNAVIIPKLKAGFVISALEVSERFGTLVHLSYFFNSDRRRMMDFRAGELKPDDRLRSAMGID